MGNETRPVGFEIAADQLAYLERWAAASDRPLDTLLSEAVDTFVAWRRDFDAAIEEGMADVAAGRVFTHEEMLEHRAEHRRTFSGD